MDDPDEPRVTLIFLRVHAAKNIWGNLVGSDRANLSQLFTEGQLQIKSPYGNNCSVYANCYSKDGLIKELVDIMKSEQPDVVRTQDPAPGIIIDGESEALQIPDIGHGNLPANIYDHNDHVWGARFAEEAVKSYGPNNEKPEYFTYKGYNLEWSEDPQARLGIRDFCFKKSIMFDYNFQDGQASWDYCDPTQFLTYSYTYIGYQSGDKTHIPN